MKTYRRISTLVMIAILVVLVLIVGMVVKFVLQDSVNENWQMSVKADNASMEKMMSQETTYLPKATKDELTKRIAINNYRLENNVPPTTSKSLWGFMNDSAGLVSIITLFTIIVGASSVAGEFSWGTIKLLLIRPVSRSKVLLAKYLSSLLFALAMLFVLFITSFLFGGILFGFSDISQPYLSYTNGAVQETSMTFHIITVYAFNSVRLIMMSTFAFMISSVFRSSSLAIGLAIFLMFTGDQLVAFLSQYSWVKYILFANIDLNRYFDGVPLVEGMTLGFSITVLIIYFAVFNLISWFIFNKRDVAA